MDVRIAYASETGRAEALAWRCRSWLRLRNVATSDPVPLDALTTESTTTIIFAATAGDGAPPSNAKKFWSALLRKGAPRLDGKRYALYGLGDANNDEKRVKYMHALTEMSTDVVLPLVAALATDDTYLRRNIALTLGHIGDPRAAAALTRTADVDSDAGVQEAARAAASAV